MSILIAKYYSGLFITKFCHLYIFILSFSMGFLHTLFNKIAYHPPENPKYNLVEDTRSKKLKLKLAVFISNPPCYRKEFPDHMEVVKIRTKRGHDIVGVYVKNPSASLTVLYSHNNGLDLGLLIRFKWLEKLSEDLGVNVMAYDYSGYGQSTGKPSEKNTYADIEAAYECLVDSYGAKEEDVILYGCSIGSGPTIDLATRLPKLRGVVLESAFTSALRLVGLGLKRGTDSFDIYNNLKKIRLVSCPVVVIHGTEDEMVDVRHGKQLWAHSKCKYEPLWVEGGEHMLDYSDIRDHLKKFVADMEKECAYIEEVARASVDNEREKSRVNSEEMAGEEQGRNDNGKSSRSVRLLDCFKPKLEHDSHK